MRLKMDNLEYIYALDPKINRRCVFLIHKGYAISLATGFKFKYPEKAKKNERRRRMKDEEIRNRIKHAFGFICWCIIVFIPFLAIGTYIQEQRFLDAVIMTAFLCFIFPEALKEALGGIKWFGLGKE